jgi:hypothetical protein
VCRETQQMYRLRASLLPRRPLAPQEAVEHPPFVAKVGLPTTHHSSSAFLRASRAARCVACHGVRSHAVPVALVGECCIPVV